MAERKIISIGFNCPGDGIEYLPLNSERSLLDADIILFEPDLPSISYRSVYDPFNGSKKFQGKTMLDEESSFSAKADMSHWRAELETAFDAGKTIIVFLSKPVEVFIDTGEKEVSGTGRNAKKTLLVTPFSSYSALPYKFVKITPKSGEIIVPAPNLKYLAGYWRDFADYSQYEVYVECKFDEVFLTTKTGNKVVGGALHGENGKGTVLFLPPLRYNEDPFVEDSENDDQQWTKEAIAFAKRLVSAVVALDKAVRISREATPAPSWVQSPNYRFIEEMRIEAEIQAMTAEIERLRVRKAKLVSELEPMGNLRSLLYESGKPLESAILESLTLMGFTAETYHDAESEFDAVFSSAEGRFLGEAEGKDKHWIDVNKLRQLEGNIQEDFARAEVTDHAKGVLFGNAYRLTPLAERSAFFTAKDPLRN